MRKKPDNNYPKIAVDSLIQRASDIVVICRKDRKELCKEGLDWKLVENLAALIDPCTDMEAEYRFQKSCDQEKTAQMQERIVQCTKLRDAMVKAVRTAFLSAGIKAAVPSFPRKQSGASLIQDLSDIAAFCCLNAGELKNTNFDFSLADKARSTIEELTNELADNDLRKIQPSKILEKRNRLCNELYKKMVEICAAGKKAFENDPQRKKAYRIRRHTPAK